MNLVRSMGFAAVVAMMIGVVACSSDDAASVPDPGAPDGGASGTDSGAGTGDGGTSGDASDGGSTTPTLHVLSGISLPGYPHPIDVYAPSNAERAVVFLHGGGGTKEGGAVKEIAIANEAVAPATTPSADTAWLLASKTAFILPQGQALDSAPKAKTWSNYVMKSGVDDVAFLEALSAAIRGGSLNAEVPKVGKVYLAGHSNGGMMANRIWCEKPTAFEAYSGLAGPASVQLDPETGAHPCAPSVARPYLAIVGDADTILQTKDAWATDTWAVNACLQQGDGGSFDDPALINEVRFHAVRVAKICGTPGSGAVDSPDGKTTTWSACDGHAMLVRVKGADHCVVAGPMPCRDNKLLGGNCDNSLEAESTKRMRDVLLEFFVASEK